MRGRWVLTLAGDGEPVPPELARAKGPFRVVPVVPCDDAAVERVATVLLTFDIRSSWSAADIAQAVLAAAAK